MPPLCRKLKRIFKKLNFKNMINKRLDYLREQIEDESISYGEILELEELNSLGLIGEDDYILNNFLNICN